MWNNMREVNELWNLLIDPERMKPQYSASRTKFRSYIPGVDLDVMVPFWSEIFNTESLYSKGGLRDGSEFSMTTTMAVKFIYLAV